jgi:toxoflavin biosynthesis protein ToxD
MDGRIYPWGDAFDKSKCNTQESNTFSTTPVGSYPGGASPYGAQDMAGNVWEWTSSSYSAGKYVLRGGSWAQYSWDARTARRNDGESDDVGTAVGFRLAWSVAGS